MKVIGLRRIMAFITNGQYYHRINCGDHHRHSPHGTLISPNPGGPARMPERRNTTRPGANPVTGRAETSTEEMPVIVG
jgi:hypothetical protein